MEFLKITENTSEMVEIGKKLLEVKGKIYTEKMIDTIFSKIRKQMPDASSQEHEEAFYRSIYDYWVYGNNIGEEFYLDFRNKSHEEKNEFMTFRNRYLYIRHLNKNADANLLQDKYQAYKKLEPYYMRDVIEIVDEKDIIHIPKVLYHWRGWETSTAGNPEIKLYAYESGRKAVEDHINRIGLKGIVVSLFI